MHRINRCQRKSWVPPVIYVSCPRCRSLLPFSLHAAAARLDPSHAAAAPQPPPRRHHSPPLACTPSRRRRAPFSPPRNHRSAPCAARARLPRQTPPCAPSAARASPPPTPPARSRASKPCAAPTQPRLLATTTAHPHPVLAGCSRFCLLVMGREKRKGKEVVVEEPVCKRTRAEREAERAEMVAKAAEEQASGRARPFAIRDPPARGRGRGRGMG